MPYRKEQFVNGEIYHTVVRAIDNNIIFQDADDYYRGIFSIYEFNNAKSVSIRKRREERAVFKRNLQVESAETGSQSVLEADKREKLVEVLAFCLMPNHVHLLLRQLEDNGITKFMHKFGIGLGGYFNRKHDRKGPVFQNRFVSVPVGTEEQLKIIFVYIHSNPVSLIEPKWKELGVRDPEKVIEFIENYKWSSYPDYLAKKNFPSVTEREFLLERMGGSISCRQHINEWIRHKEELRKMISRVEKSLRNKTET